MNKLHEQALHIMSFLMDSMYALYHEIYLDGSIQCFTGLAKHEYESFPSLKQYVDNEQFQELWQWGYLAIIDRRQDAARQTTQYTLTEMGKLDLSITQNPHRPQRSLTRLGRDALSKLAIGYSLHIIEIDRADAGYKTKAHIRNTPVSNAVMLTLLQNGWVQKTDPPERTSNQPRGWHHVFHISPAGCLTLQQAEELIKPKTKRGLKKLPQRRYEEEQIDSITQKIVSLIVDEIGINTDLVQNRAYLRVLFRAVRRGYMHERLKSMASSEIHKSTL